MAFSNPPGWLKRLARIDLDDIAVKDRPVRLEVRGRGLVPVWRGWWLLELAPGQTGALRFVDLVFAGRGGGDALEVRAVLGSGRSSKRLVYAEWPLDSITLQPAGDGAGYSIRRLRLAPALRSFALPRLHGFLVRGSRDLRGQPRAAQTAARDPAGTGGRREHDRASYAEYDAAMRRIAEGGQQLYEHWIETAERDLFRSTASGSAPDGPRISILMPVHNPPEPFLRQAIESVIGQDYPDWELCIADDASDPERIRPLLEEYRAADARINVSYLEHHGHISRASNRALDTASGDFVTFLDHDDRLSPHALSEVVAALHERPDLDILYSDEDFLDPGGRRCSPHFKSDWNPYLLYSHNYVTHLCVYRRDLVERAGRLREGLEGAQDYDLLLRCSRLTAPARIHHIPKILYHWRMAPTSTALHADRKGYAAAAGRRALQDHFAALGERVRVVSAGSENFFRVEFQYPEPRPLVSLVVPTRDQVALLRRCVDGLLNRTAYRPLEILIVDNRSEAPETLGYLAEIARHPAVRVLRFDEPFNFARICNLGVEQARGEVVGLVNNDVDVIDPGWLDEMVMLAVRPEVGCVGAKLLYADDTIQHAGVILGLGGYAAHSHRCYTRDSDGYFNRLKVRQNLSAVTAACLVMRRALYREVGGMDERLAVAYNDVDLGLKVRQAGYLNVFTPFAELYHLESKTRGYDDTAEKQARFQREKNYLAAKWGDAIRLDPYYNPNLTHSREDFTLAP